MTEQGTEAPPATVQQPAAPGAPAAAPRPPGIPPGATVGYHYVPGAMAAAALAERRGWFTRHKLVTEPDVPQFAWLYFEVGRKLDPAEVTGRMLGDFWLYTIVWRMRTDPALDHRQNRPVIDRTRSQAITPFMASDEGVHHRLPSLQTVMGVIEQNPRPGFLHSPTKRKENGK